MRKHTHVYAPAPLDPRFELCVICKRAPMVPSQQLPEHIVEPMLAEYRFGVMDSGCIHIFERGWIALCGVLGDEPGEVHGTMHRNNLCQRCAKAAIKLGWKPEEVRR